MKRHQIVHTLILPGSAILALVCGGGAVARTALPNDAHSPRFSGHRYAEQARITLADARDIAVKARPGTITDEELERERGGSGLRYSFDVRNAAATWEVGVDAKTGAVLENDREGAHPD